MQHPNLFDMLLNYYAFASRESLVLNLSTDHDLEISKNSWHYSKKFIEIPSHILPEFEKQECNKYFRKSPAAVNTTKLCATSDWIPRLTH